MKADQLGFPFLPKVQGGKITETALELPEKLTFEQWEEIGRGLGKVEQATQWWVGDWWAYGGDKEDGKWSQGKRKEIVESDQWNGPAFDTCVGAARVCRAFESRLRRRLSLTWYHHKEVASLPDEEADQLLDWCEEESATVRELRERVKQVKAYLTQGWNASQLERKAQLEKGGLPVLANMSTDEKGVAIDNALITWAESEGLTVRIDRQSDWGNPYEVDADGTREEVIEWYAEYFAHKRSLHKKLRDLAGKLLLCWCHPQECHGNVLIKQLDAD